MVVMFFKRYFKKIYAIYRWLIRLFRSGGQVIGINQEELKNNKQCRNSIVGPPVISVLRKVFCVAHSDLNETDVSKDAIFERFRDKITYQFCEKFFEKKSVVVYASPAKICLISESMTPTPEDLTILAGEGIEYDDIKWSVDILEFGSWIAQKKLFRYLLC